ncbi:hypothetical protein CDV26_05815 [Francisella halioticida]|uniref:Uncharacterized protein n=1 Tax=Francisella halioticida TaxID=549298 RepID=A0ABN5AW85_9GAMM|nr:hypothetical protein CDV26_05815 [Francisella halioticida]
MKKILFLFFCSISICFANSHISVTKFISGIPLYLSICFVISIVISLLVKIKYNMEIALASGAISLTTSLLVLFFLLI